MSLNIVRRPVVDNSALCDDPLLSRIYASRGITDSQSLTKQLNNLAHFKVLRGVDAAVNLLANAITEGKRIVVVGDFDADGATSTALCMLAFSMLGSKQHTYLVPNRFDFGYGLSPEIVDVAHEQGVDVIMTVDNGIACIAGVERAKSLGIDVVITDHHLPGDTLPAADAIVNPNQPDCDFPSKNLAGVGVAFYLMLALRSHLQSQNWFTEQGLAVPNLATLLDIVALGTVADVVTLDHNNRILVHQGIQRIRSMHCRPGIQAMLDVAGRDPTRLAASDLGFVLGPRLNAAGRLDDMSMGIECLLTEDRMRARHIASQLDSLNRERREIEASMQKEAEQALDALVFADDTLPTGLILYKADYHQGVIGILAGRIKDKHYRPTIAFAHQDDNVIKGSARSIPGIHIRDLLDEINTRHPDLILKFGGHAMAAGLSVEVEKLKAFEEAFIETTTRWMAGKPLEGEILSDGELNSQQLSMDTATLLRQGGPWGQGFDEPTFDGEFMLLDQRIVGEKHLKMTLQHNGGEVVDAIAFGVDTTQWPDPNAARVHIAYRLDINEFRGRKSLQLIVQALDKVVRGSA